MCVRPAANLPGVPRHFRVQASAVLAGDPNNHATNTWHYADLTDSLTNSEVTAELLARIDAFYTALVAYLLSLIHI